MCEVQPAVSTKDISEPKYLQHGRNKWIFCNHIALS